MLTERTVRPTVLADLVQHLPPDAALWRDPDAGPIWGSTQTLLAAVVNLLAAANWQRAGDQDAPRPDPIGPFRAPANTEEELDELDETDVAEIDAELERYRRT